MKWNRSLETKPQSYSHLIFDKGAQNMHQRQKDFSKNGAGKTEYQI
jgi:hypothetical protein